MKKEELYISQKEKIGFKNTIRSSNLELLRIILMITIVAHHYVVNSGITEKYDYSNITGNMIFLQFFGFGGKMAINAFILISGYFMCKSKLTYHKILKLYLEIKFYAIVIYSIFLLSGYQLFNIKDFIKTMFNCIYGVNTGFTGSFMVFYLFIPFMNKLISNMGQNMHLRLICILVFVYTIVGTFFGHNIVWNYIGWYITLYFIASYIRLYPNRWTENIRVNIVGLLVSLVLIFTSILVVDFVGSKFGFTDIYYMFSDSHKFLALTCALCLFLTFKNLQLRYSKSINTIAMSTFGVLLIHANSDSMRKFLWKDVFKNSQYYTSEKLWIHAIVSVLIIYTICTIIDYIRIRFIEKKIMNYINDKIIRKWNVD